MGQAIKEQEKKARNEGSLRWTKIETESARGARSGCPNDEHGKRKLGGGKGERSMLGCPKRGKAWVKIFYTAKNENQVRVTGKGYSGKPCKRRKVRKEMTGYLRLTKGGVKQRMKKRGGSREKRLRKGVAQKIGGSPGPGNSVGSHKQKIKMPQPFLKKGFEGERNPPRKLGRGK